ncbi:hypothetical protein EV199_1136 [Pseudobacter ginsenosidimutans]|uniref:Uncharacterized protein n=1 Tax=Pseudobacter ginsenosidimutans TaxID=661488 RepID=A0A4Q7N1N2_9BACT|nr:hypothetical protein EV199_1136 [Pseudobacter ginsenosidimutans]
MKLKFFDPREAAKTLKATAHKNGKLGFSADAAKKMELAAGKGARIAFDEENPEDKTLYVIISSMAMEDTFKIIKAGEYFYLNARSLFEELELDYKNDNIVYDISEVLIDGRPIYKFTKRAGVKKVQLS